MDITTFGAFTTARLGIYAAQKALNVTGHNISNINTAGYTRQKVDQVSLRVGATNHYASAFGGKTGSGVLITGMSQFRDPYLDIRYRNENSSVGAMDTKLGGLEELSSILDEVGKGGEGKKGEGILAAQFQDLRNQLAKLTGDQSTEDEFLTLARSSADSLVKLMNNYAKRLAEVQENQENGFKKDVSSVNDILKNIQTLNENIQKSEIYGDSALELRDQRNLLIDQLSKYMKVDVTNKQVSVGAGQKVEKLVITTAGHPSATLVNGNYVGQLSISDGVVGNPDHVSDPSAPQYLKPDGTATDNPDEAQKVEYTLNLSTLTDRNGNTLANSEHTFGDTELYGSLQASRELLTEAGEYSTIEMTKVDADATTKRGIPYYENALDSLARKFASVMNAANTGYLQDSNGNILKSGTTDILATKNSDGSYTMNGTKYSTLEKMIHDEGTNFTDYAEALGGALFSNSSDGDLTGGITAANISISQRWSTDPSFLQNSFQALEGESHVGSSDNDNIVHILAQFDLDHDYTPGEIVDSAVDGSKKFFSGSFEEMFTNIEETLATDVKSTTTLENNYSVSATELDSDRDSVSSVDLNDEAMNMMQFQKSYSAACRMMTTLDEVLGKLINGTGIAGR
jgi:flagellar hook-associated protein 1 FlgK